MVTHSLYFPVGSELTYVTKLNENDVLFGRGSRNLENEGNVRFRNLIKQRKKEYSDATKRARKDAIAREIVTSIACLNGRFLRKVEAKMEFCELQLLQGDSMKDIWVPVDDETIVLKVKQAFRNCDGYSDEHSYNKATASAHTPPTVCSSDAGILARSQKSTSTSTKTQEHISSFDTRGTMNSFPRGAEESNWQANLKYDHLQHEKGSKVDIEMQCLSSRCRKYSGVHEHENGNSKKVFHQSDTFQSEILMKTRMLEQSILFNRLAGQNFSPVPGTLCSGAPTTYLPNWYPSYSGGNRSVPYEMLPKEQNKFQELLATLVGSVRNATTADTFCNASHSTHKLKYAAFCEETSLTKPAETAFPCKKRRKLSMP